MFGGFRRFYFFFFFPSSFVLLGFFPSSVARDENETLCFGPFRFVFLCASHVLAFFFVFQSSCWSFLCHPITIDIDLARLLDTCVALP